MSELALLERTYIATVAGGFGSPEAIYRRLYNLPIKLKDKLQLVFGQQAGERQQQLLQMQIVYLMMLADALKNDDVEAMNESTGNLYRNADEIAAAYAEINPFWSEAEWKKLLYAYTSMNIEQAVALMGGNFEKDLDIFDRLRLHMLTMGDYLADGIIQYLTIREGDELPEPIMIEVPLDQMPTQIEPPANVGPPPGEINLSPTQQMRRRR